jgi:hypothetical protein
MNPRVRGSGSCTNERSIACHIRRWWNRRTPVSRALQLPRRCAHCDPDCVISFVGSRNRIEARVVPKYGYPFDGIWIAGLQRRLSLRTAAVASATACVVVSILAYPAPSPPACCDRHRRVRIGSPALCRRAHGPAHTDSRAERISRYHDTQTRTAGGRSACQFAGQRTDCLQNAPAPSCRAAIPCVLSLRRHDTGDARVHFGLHPSRKTLLVFGGSLGARSINRAVRPLVPRLVREEYQLVWQTGQRNSRHTNHSARCITNRSSCGSSSTTWTSHIPRQIWCCAVRVRHRLRN